MDVMNTLMMYGLAAVMIFFIALITAGIVLGTTVALMSFARQATGARRTISIPAEAERESAALWHGAR